MKKKNRLKSKTLKLKAKNEMLRNLMLLTILMFCASQVWAETERVQVTINDPSKKPWWVEEDQRREAGLPPNALESEAELEGRLSALEKFTAEETGKHEARIRKLEERCKKLEESPSNPSSDFWEEGLPGKTLDTQPKSSGAK